MKISYELAKKLRDAGFNMPLTDHEMCDYQQVEFFDGVFCHVPSLEELIEACGDVIIRFWCNKKLYQYGVQKEGVVLDDVVWYPTPEEAIANLWLELNKK